MAGRPHSMWSSPRPSKTQCYASRALTLHRDRPRAMIIVNPEPTDVASLKAEHWEGLWLCRDWITRDYQQGTSLTGVHWTWTRTRTRQTRPEYYLLSHHSVASAPGRRHRRDRDHATGSGPPSGLCRHGPGHHDPPLTAASGGGPGTVTARPPIPVTVLAARSAAALRSTQAKCGVNNGATDKGPGQKSSLFSLSPENHNHL